MSLGYPEELMLEDNKQIIDEILKDDKVHIEIKKFFLEEDFVNDCSYISCSLDIVSKEVKTIDIKGEGCGVIDALLSGVFDYFSSDYLSLQNVWLYDFLVEVDFKKGKSVLNTDAPVEIKIALRGGNGTRLYFKAKSDSLVKAGIGATCNAIEYLINAEMAVLQLRKDIILAKKRQRLDLENSYICQLLELVKFVSYSETIDKNAL